MPRLAAAKLYNKLCNILWHISCPVDRIRGPNDELIDQLSQLMQCVVKTSSDSCLLMSCALCIFSLCNDL